MSTSIENLRRLAERDVKDHTALFDLYVTVGRDIDYLAIKFGIDPEDLINLLEGYGEKLRITAADVEANPKLAVAIMEDKATAKAIEEFGVTLNYSGKGRYKKLSRLLIEEYIERFYPGIASEKPENNWICLEAYLDRFHPGWKNQVSNTSYVGGSETGNVAGGSDNADSNGDGSTSSDATRSICADEHANVQPGLIRPKKTDKKKVRNSFKLY